MLNILLISSHITCICFSTTAVTSIDSTVTSVHRRKLDSTTTAEIIIHERERKRSECTSNMNIVTVCDGVILNIVCLRYLVRAE